MKYKKIISITIMAILVSSPVASAVLCHYSIIYEGSTIRLDNSYYNSYIFIGDDKIIFEKVAGYSHRYNVKVNSLSNSICQINEINEECEYRHYKIIVEGIETNNLLKIKVLDTRLARLGMKLNWIEKFLGPLV